MPKNEILRVSLKEQNTGSFKMGFFFFFQIGNSSWQIVVMVALDQNSVKKRYLKTELSKFYENWQN